jgi:hypothetical protein
LRIKVCIVPFVFHSEVSFFSIQVFVHDGAIVAHGIVLCCRQRGGVWC